jgi:hypothetical protein
MHEQLVGPQLVRKFPKFCGPQTSIVWSYETAICPCPERNESSPCLILPEQTPAMLDEIVVAFSEFCMLAVSLCIKFWFCHVIPKCLHYVAFSKELSSTFACNFVIHFADSVVSIEKWLQAGRSRVQITKGAWDFSLIQWVQTSSGDHQSPYSVGTWVLAGAWCRQFTSI